MSEVTSIGVRTKAGRIAAALSREITAGTYAPGMLLPTERELAGSYGVAMNTLRKSLAILVDEGVLTKHPQRGVVVATPQNDEVDIAQIAFITPALNADAAPYVEGLLETIDHDRFALATYATHADMDKYRIVLRSVTRQSPAGIIIWVMPDELCHLPGEVLRDVDFPVVTIGPGRLEGIAGDHVRDSIADGASKVAKLIARRECKNIAFLGATSHEVNRPVVDALRSELSGTGVQLDAARVLTADTPRGYAQPPDPYSDTEEFMAKILADGFSCDCLVCSHDYPAVSALRAAIAAGVNVPEDMKIISLGQTAVRGVSPMELTTLDLHRERQARMAAELLMRRIDGYAGPAEVHHLPTDLIEGQTT